MRLSGRTPRRAGRRPVLAVLAVVAMLGLSLIAPALPASAAPNSLQIDKTVDNATPRPGQNFTYTIQIRCSEEDCLNTQLTDAFPAGLEGFGVANVTFTPNATAVPRTVTWGPGGTATPPATLGPDTTLTVDLDQVLDDPVGTGLGAGLTFTVQVTLRVPDDYPPGTGPAIVNTARVTADNANAKQSSATVNVDAPVNLGVAVDKSWSPGEQTFDPGSPSTIGVDARNTSNVAVDTLTLQEPKAAPAGAATLDASNPFTITDFTGFGDVALPAGCESVRVEAYVLSGTTWDWVGGDPTPTPTTLALPGGVDPGDVGGIRVTCTGDMAPGQTLSVDLGLEQRATDRNTDADLSTSTRTVANVATGSAAVEDDTVTDDGNASYTVRPLVPSVEAAKNIEPQRITAGQSSTATVGATNGNTPATQLTISDRGFFTEDVTFGGFDGPLGWPAAATEATVTYYLLAGGTQTGTVSQGQVVPPPTGPISGFDITWDGPIAANETGGATFGIDTTEDATGGAAEVSLRNAIDVEVTAANGLTDTATDADTLEIVDPRVSVTLSKTVRPRSPVNPGETVISSLATTATATGDGAVLEEIVATDVWGGDCNGFWNAFDLSAIAPTQLPSQTVLDIEVQGQDGVWRPLASFGPTAGASTVRLTPAETTAALASAGLGADDVVGIRFGFSNADGFPAQTTVTPNIVYSARGTLRDTSCPTPPRDTPVTYLNAATADVTGESDGGRPLTDEDDDTDQAVVVYPSTAPGPLDIEKSWDEVAVSSQSADRAGTDLRWSVSEGFSSVTVTDMAGSPVADVAETVFDAFDLVAVDPIAASNDPFSNGWYLKYDSVTQVELYDSGADAWVTVPAPAGSWMTAGRAFKGHQLSPAERASTTAVRITVAETPADTARRTAANAPGAAFDPFAPDPGSGVGAGSADREFGLTWELRDTKRSSGDFVVEDELYNTDDAGVVDNTVELTGVPIGGGDPVSDTDNDTIQILDPDPLVAVSKDVDPASDVFTPPVGTPTADYPTASWSIVGRNASTARASYVRLTDPATCTDTTLVDCQSAGTPAGALADPFDTSADYLTNASAPNPFQRFDATSITIGASIPGQVDLDATTVWLLRYSGGSYSTEQTTASAVNALTEAQLATVVGLSVTFQDTDPATAGGTITQANALSIDVESRLRATLRSSGESFVLRAGQTYDQTNRVFAQSYDPVTSPGVVTGDVDDATVVLTGGVVNITPTKSVAPARITEPQHDADNDTVTVTLGANQGSDPRSTLSPAQVVVEDQAGSPDFWNAVDFTGNVTITQLPAGADQVQVDLYDGTTWVTGTPGPAGSVTLPEVDAADVQGIRFTYSRADGRIFSTALPAPNYTAAARFTVDVRDTYRDSGDPIVFPSTLTNTQSSQSTRPDGNDSEVETATATVQLVPGTRELAVNKLTNEGNRLASVGDAVPFDLTLRNVGTGYLTMTELVDALPPELLFTGDPAPEFTADPDGTLSEDVTVTPAADGRSVTFTWPEDGNVLQPGEEFVIRLYLELQPGLGAGESATNTMTARTEQELARCTNTVAGGSTTGDFASDNRTCGTSDYVGTVSGPNLFTIKGVRGSLPGAYRPGRPGPACPQNLEATGGSYFRPGCVVNSQVGGTDDWVLHQVNTGTVPIEEMTIFDQLPVRGDALLVSGNPRGSAYRPQLVADSLEVTAPAGTTQVVEVTTSPDVCVGTWEDLATQPACEQSGEVWETAGADTDWSSVTGLRIRLDFRTTPLGRLNAGQFVDVTYSTTNELASSDDPSGASRVVPAGNQIAWNQHGVKFRNSGSTSSRQIAPSRVGVDLRVGTIEVVKEITGPAADYAPDEILVDVACEVGQGEDAEQLDLGANATLELTEAGDYTARVFGIPLSEQGTYCTVSEQGETGEFGETTRSGSPTTLLVSEPSNPYFPPETQDTPTAQIATLGNDYQFTGLSVTKRVDTEATGTDFGPFEFSLACTSISGDDVTFDDDGTTTAVFEIEADGTWTAPADRIPVGATCTLTETDDFFADDLVFTGTNVVDNGDGTATITPGVDPAEVEVTNAYDAGTFTLEKVVDGDGADLYGTGSFEFDVTCTWQGQTPYDDTVALRAGESQTLGPFPTGTRCAVEETRSAGATSTVLDPVDGEVVIPAPGEEQPASVTLTATNTFDLTSLEVLKRVVGETGGDRARGPFTVALECTWDVDGTREPVAVPGGAERTLSRANGYRASYGDLPSSAACALEEVDTGGADSTRITLDIAGDQTVVDGTSAEVDLSTTDGPGQAVARLVNRFGGGGVTPGGVDSGGTLPSTGADYGRSWIALGMLLLLAGAATTALGRRRPEA